MENSSKLSWGRIIFGSLLVAIIAGFEVNLLTVGTGFAYGFFLSLILMLYLSQKKEKKEAIKHFQYKTASILCFFMPLSAIIYSFAFSAQAVSGNDSGAYKAGAAVGSFIGGGIVTVVAFIIGLSLGIVFHLMSKPKK